MKICKNNSLVVVCAILASFIVIAMPFNVSAGSEDSGYTPEAKCGDPKISSTWKLDSRSSSPTSTCEFSGHGWMYFEYIDKSFRGSVTYAPDIFAKSTVIPEVCSEIGGFYHYGYFQYKYTSGSRGNTTATMNGLAQIGSPAYDEAGSKYNRAYGSGWTSTNGLSNWNKILDRNSRGSHILKVNGVPVAQNVEPVSDEIAWRHYLDWRSSEYSKNFPQTWSKPHSDGGVGKITYFCYGDGLKDSAFTGEIRAYIDDSLVGDGDTFNVSDETESVTINYVDSVTRKNDTSEYNPVEITFSGKDDKNAGSAYTETRNISTGATVYKAIPATVALLADTTTICHTLNHPTTLTKEGVVTGDAEHKHCITIKKSPLVPDTCGTLGIEYSKLYGRTDAQMVFSFNGKNYKLGIGGDTESPKTVWAVPGDNVRYTYKMCDSTEKPRNSKNDRANVGFENADPSFEITAQSPAHIFDLTKTTYLKGDFSSSFYFEVASPRTNNYGCTITSGSAHRTNHYQVPAGTGCGASSISDSDVGKSFYQQIKYKKMIAEERYARVPPYTQTDYSNCLSRDPETNLCTSYGTKPAYNYEYWSELTSNSSTSLRAEVKTPYNYTLVPYTKRFGHSDGVVYAGSTFSTQSYVATIKQHNNATGKDYATHSKPTKIIIAYFTTNDSNIEKLSGSTGVGDINERTICGSFGVRYATCNAEKTFTGQILNRHDGQLEGSTDENKSISGGGSNIDGVMSIPVPIVPAGLKMCVAVGVYPADSHNRNTSSQAAAMSDQGNTYAIGVPACVTIAKKPTFSVESGDFYTNGNVETSTSTINNRTFGSWAEYGLVAAGTVDGMASGAAFGYRETPYSAANPNYAGSSDNNYRSGIVNTGSNNIGIPKDIRSECSYSQQTFGNRLCDAELGNDKIINRNTAIARLVDRIKKIYLKTPAQMNVGYDNSFGVRDLSTNATTLLKHGETGTIIPVVPRGQAQTSLKNVVIDGEEYSPLFSIAGSEGACQYSSNLGRYVGDVNSRLVYTKDIKNDGSISGNSNWVPSVHCTSDGNKYYRSSMNLILTSGLKNTLAQDIMGGAGTSDLDHEGNIVKDSYRNPVYIYDVKGTMVIDQNIITHNGSRGDNFESLDQIPMVIIMADNVKISDRVNRIDAWIITPGNLNTCAVDTSGMSDNYVQRSDGRYYYNIPTGTVTGLKMIESKNLTSQKCNKELIINGTVFAGSLTLNRTYGGGAESVNDTASFIKRGEIFNQRADTFYWSYYQAQRSRVMTTVYSRELPTRY